MKGALLEVTDRSYGFIKGRTRHKKHGWWNGVSNIVSEKWELWKSKKKS